MKFSYYLPFIMLLLLAGCKEKKHEHQHEHQTDHNKSNIHMNKNAFEDLVKGFEDPSRDSWQKPDTVIALLGDVNGKTIMDIGAGTGYFTFRLAEKGATVIAADVDERFLNYIENKKEVMNAGSVTTRKVPYDDALLKAQEAYAVIIVNTYHHIENRVAYFKKVLNGIRPGGILMVVDYKKEKTPHGPPLNHRLPAEEVRAELEKAGFGSVEQHTELLEYQYIIMAKRPM